MTDPQAALRSTLELAGYRALVADSYTDVRRTADVEAAWSRWRATRDDLLLHHPQGALAGSPGASAPGFWPYDPSWRVLGTVTAADVAPLEVAEADGAVRRFEGVGVVAFEREGVSHRLDLWWADGYGGGLFLPFRDRTTGTTTAGSGRYLLDGAKGADLGREGARLVLDFNFAYHPSCVWGAWVCPLPPPGNALDVEVRAGEQAGEG